MSHPLVGWRTSDQDGWGLRSNLICRGIFEDFHARSKRNLYSKIATPRCLNAFAYALMPSHASKGAKILRDPQQLAWRNALLTKSLNPNLQAIIALGEQAQDAVGLWGGKGTLPVIAIPHPSSRDPKKLADGWRNAVTQLRAFITPDLDGNPALPNYGSELEESDYAPIPKHDLPFGLPDWFGDDAWGRRATPAHANCVNRPKSNSKNGLSWVAPRSGIDV